MIENILTLGFIVAFIVTLLRKSRIIDWFEAAHKIRACYFCWSFWIALLIVLPIAIIEGNQYIYHVKSLIGITMISTFLTTVILLNDGRD